MFSYKTEKKNLNDKNKNLLLLLQHKVRLEGILIVKRVIVILLKAITTVRE